MKSMSSISILFSLPILILLIVLLCQELLPSWTIDHNINKLHSNYSQGSCSSKIHQHLYRRSKLAPPKEALTQLWRSYKETHKFCTAHRNWSMFLNNDVNDHCRYLFYVETDTGLGNRILSLVTAALYALITDRVLMLGTRGSLSSILCEPIQGSSWLLPKEFPMGILDTGPSLETAMAKGFNISLVRLLLDHVQSESDKKFFCDQVQDQLFNVKSLAWFSNQYYITSLFEVPILWNKLVPLFNGNHMQVFAQVARLVIFPANHVWEMIIRFYNRQYLASSSILIGFQVRPHFRPNITAFDPYITRLLEECLQTTLLLPKVVGYSTKLHREQGKFEYSIFVASLQGKYFEYLRDLYKRAYTEDGKRITVHSLSNEGFEQHTMHQDELALAEIWLLSFADYIVISEFSTFGYIAHGICGVRPLMLGIKENVGCFRSVSSEPCTHFPQKATCVNANGTNYKHREWIEKHVKRCQDHYIGFQLVD